MRNKFTPVLVTVKSKIKKDNYIEFDERLFTSSRKLNSYLKMLKNNYSDLHINFKTYKL